MPGAWNHHIGERFRVLIEDAQVLQIGHDTADGAGRETCLTRHVAHTLNRLVKREAVQDGYGTIEHLNLVSHHYVSLYRNCPKNDVIILPAL
jgi:hypothetical protein